jgi:hypothetical protein
MTQPHLVSRFLLGTALLAAAACSVAAEPVAYPEGYRDWRHVKSMVILPGHPLENPFAGIHHIYANPAAAAGLRSGDYADGAVLVFDLLEADTGGSAIQEGTRKLVGVMWRDQDGYAATGGWGFEGFAGASTDERLTKDGGQSCFDCHRAQERHGYVFTQPRK